MSRTPLSLLLALSALAAGCVTLTAGEEEIIDAAPVAVEEARFERHIAKYERDMTALRQENLHLKAEIEQLKKVLAGRRPVTKRHLEQMVENMVTAEARAVEARLKAEQAALEEKRRRDEAEKAAAEKAAEDEGTETTTPPQ